MKRANSSNTMDVRKRVDQPSASHQRLWWMELVRGAITGAGGLLFLTARSFAPRAFMYSLGAYLVIDGTLELADVYRKKYPSRLKACDVAGGILSLCAGLLSLSFPTVTLLVLARIIAVRLLFSGVSHLQTARRARGPHATLSWASSGFFFLLALFLLLLPQLAMMLLVVFLGGYMLIAGLVLLLRGLFLRLGFRGFPASHSQLPQVPPELSNVLPPSTRRALVFVRQTAADGLGHIAWGFEWMNGWFNVGSVENLKGKPFADPHEMGFWSTHTLDPLATIQRREHPYDEYKLFLVTEPHPKEAWKTVIWESQEPYSLVHHNCCDVTYEIVRTYGCTEVLDPAREAIPNDWYDALPGASYPISASPAIPICLHRHSRRELALREVPLVISSRMSGSPPPWRTVRWRPWEELSLAWEMMIGHLCSLWTASITRSAPHRRSSRRN